MTVHHIRAVRLAGDTQADQVVATETQPDANLPGPTVHLESGVACRHVRGVRAGGVLADAAVVLPDCGMPPIRWLDPLIRMRRIDGAMLWSLGAEYRLVRGGGAELNASLIGISLIRRPTEAGTS